MDPAWLPLTSVCERPSGVIEAEARIPDDSPWFSGHFPGNPMLPGVAILALVAEIVSTHAKPADCDHFVVEGFRHVRFTEIGLPGGHIRASLSPVSGAEVRFEVTIDDQRACRGLVVVGARDDGVAGRQKSTA